MSKPAQQHRPDGLTRQERVILEEIARGESSQQVADRMYLSRRTVDYHLHNVYAFLGVRNRIQAINRARERGWLGTGT